MQSVCTSGADVIGDSGAFGIQMTDDKEFTSWRWAKQSPVLEVEETRRPFQTAAAPLPLNSHLSYFADSTFEWHGSASAQSLTYVMFYSSAFMQEMSLGTFYKN